LGTKKTALGHQSTHIGPALRQRRTPKVEAAEEQNWWDSTETQWVLAPKADKQGPCDLGGVAVGGKGTVRNSEARQREYWGKFE